MVSGCYGWKSRTEDGVRDKSVLRKLLGLCISAVVLSDLLVDHL